MSTVALRGRRPIDSGALLRELRHTDAQAAGGVTTWLHELGLARKSLRTISEYGRIADAMLGMYALRAEVRRLRNVLIRLTDEREAWEYREIARCALGWPSS